MKNKKKNIFQREGIASFGSSILAIICGLLFGLIILLASNPSQAYGGFMMILQGGFTEYSGNWTDAVLRNSHYYDRSVCWICISDRIV